MWPNFSLHNREKMVVWALIATVYWPFKLQRGRVNFVDKKPFFDCWTVGPKERGRGHGERALLLLVLLLLRSRRRRGPHRSPLGLEDAAATDSRARAVRQQQREQPLPRLRRPAAPLSRQNRPQDRAA